MTSSPLRSEKLDLRLTPGAKQTLQRAGAAAQRSVTDFVLESAMASAGETLADRQSFRLDEEQWEAFLAALDAPPQMHPRLARLLQEASALEQLVAEQPPVMRLSKLRCHVFSMSSVFCGLEYQSHSSAKPASLGSGLFSINIASMN